VVAVLTSTGCSLAVIWNAQQQQEPRAKKWALRGPIQFAVTVKSPAGILNLAAGVLALVLLVKVTAVEKSQPVKVMPVRVPGLRVTLAPAAILPAAGVEPPPVAPGLTIVNVGRLSTAQLAVAVTLLVPMTKVVVALLALAKVTPPVAVQLVKVKPVRVPALTVTVRPSGTGPVLDAGVPWEKFWPIGLGAPEGALIMFMVRVGRNVQLAVAVMACVPMLKLIVWEVRVPLVRVTDGESDQLTKLCVSEAGATRVTAFPCA
jgi:hypothetical protein